MTLEGWAMEVVRPIMAVYPLAWVFFLIFILASTFTLLNLFIAVIVNAIQQEQLSDAPPPQTAPTASATDRELIRLRREIADLRRQLQTQPRRLRGRRGVA
jgi:voltage-gated sodium channel